MEEQITATPSQTLNLEEVRKMAGILEARMKAAVQGRDDVIRLLLLAIFGDGHVLLEDYPGSGKTTLAKALGESIINDVADGIPHFKRIQFTPDLLPSDVTGATIFDANKHEFYFRRGPIFSYVALADEINRTSPKVQAALLEAMAEKQVTVDDTTHPLDELFFVIATQNPLDLVGTYPLPVAQLDRFLFKVIMKHIDRESELEVLSKWNTDRLKPKLAKVSRTEIIQARNWIRENVNIDPLIFECLVDIFREFRAHDMVIQGASTRAMILAIPALQANAVVANRNFVSAEDIETILVPLLIHRLEFRHGVEDPAQMIREISKKHLEQLAKATLK